MHKRPATVANTISKRKLFGKLRFFKNHFFIYNNNIKQTIKPSKHHINYMEIQINFFLSSLRQQIITINSLRNKSLEILKKLINLLNLKILKLIMQNFKIKN